MKYFVILLILVGFITISSQHADGICVSGTDWDKVPCESRTCFDNEPPAACTDPNWWKKGWAPYYDHKGAEWMNQKKIELLDAMKTDTLTEWKKLTPNGANNNVHDYYFYMGEVPNHNGIYVKQYFAGYFPPLKQYKAGNGFAEIKCKDEFKKIFKIGNNFLSCIKPKSFEKLLQRGWLQKLSTVNLVVSRGDLFLQSLKIEGLNETYSIGQKIEFTVKFNGTKYGCYTHPTLRIENSEHQIIWESNHIVELCDPDTTPIHFEKIWDTSNSNLGVPLLNKTGTYTLFAKFEKNIIQQDFMVKQKITPTNPCKESNMNLDLEKIPEVGEPSRLVFSVKQNTTAHICIKYSSNLDNEGALNLNEDSTDGYLGTYNGTKSNVLVTINPSFIPLQKGQLTIADYAISVPQDTDGVYWLGVSQMCDRIPIITTNHKIIPDDIPVIVGMHGCPAISLDAKIIGYSNADVQYHIAKALPGR